MSLEKIIKEVQDKHDELLGAYIVNKNALNIQKDINLKLKEDRKDLVDLVESCLQFIEEERGHSGSVENNGRTNNFFLTNSFMLAKLKTEKEDGP